MENEFKKELDDISMSLSLTASLIGTVSNSFLRANRASINNEETQKALAGMTAAFNLCQNYGYLSDIVCIIEERINEAHKMIDEVEESVFDKCRKCKEGLTVEQTYIARLYGKISTSEQTTIREMLKKCAEDKGGASE